MDPRRHPDILQLVAGGEQGYISRGRIPKAVLPDGRIAFTASLQPDINYGGFPGDPQVYAVDDSGRRPSLLTSVTMSEMSVRSDGAILYEDYKGYEDPLRKHHTSSVTRDIWLCKDGVSRLTATLSTT